MMQSIDDVHIEREEDYDDDPYAIENDVIYTTLQTADDDSLLDEEDFFLKKAASSSNNNKKNTSTSTAGTANTTIPGNRFSDFDKSIKQEQSDDSHSNSNSTVLLIMTTTPTTMKMPTDYWNLSQNEIITTSITTEDPKN
jgi:hypothetical protein